MCAWHFVFFLLHQACHFFRRAVGIAVGLTLKASLGGSPQGRPAIARRLQVEGSGQVDGQRAVHPCPLVQVRRLGGRGITWSAVFLLASDKGKPGGYALQNTLITFPSNLALVAPPAVRRADSPSKGRRYSQTSW